MTTNEIFSHTFRNMGRELGLKIELFEGRLVVIAPMWRKALSTESQFCKALVAGGILTERQMRRAARRYRLGATRQGGVIFWQIDHEERIHDGKVMYYREDCHRDHDRHPTWVSALLARREAFPGAPHETSHCLFGLHLLSNTNDTDKILNNNALELCSLATGGTQELNALDQRSLATRGTQELNDNELHELNELNALDQRSLATERLRVGASAGMGTQELEEERAKTVCVVESEKTAVILSEQYAEYVWLATGGLGNVQPDKFRPLRGRRVILFPDTDEDGTAYRRWYEAAQTVMRQPFWEDSPPISVATVLERHATTEQKQRKIDLADFLLETMLDSR